MKANQDFVVRFAGEGGQGMVTSAEGLAQAASSVGYHVMTHSTFPSQILGGPTFAQTRIAATPILSPGDELDVLVAFNKEAYEIHRDEVRRDGVIIYNSQDFRLEPGGQSFGMPFGELAKATGNSRAENMVVIGAFAQLIGMPQEYLERFVATRFTRGRAGDEEIVRSNIQALGLGREQAAKSGFSVGVLPTPEKRVAHQILVKGNEAVALGALAGGLDVYIAYPISPANTVLAFMGRNLVGSGKFVYQASSEIESINATVGAGYAGKKTMTCTSGPGFSLMHEGIGMAWMTEVPCVIVDIQRGGPATGLPTKTEQSDLSTALTPAHGDAMLPVLAPGTVEECFYAAAVALNWAERYQGPVIVLGEQMLSERSQNIPKPDLSKLAIENRKVYQGGYGYRRYDGFELSPMSVPGSPGAYVANASEHDAIGDTTHLPSRHIQMTKRRFSKLALLQDGKYERENADETITVMPWGGSKGPAREAYNKLREQGERIAWYYTMHLHPLPPNLLKELRRKELVLVPELNYLGQFSSYLRSLGVRAESITQYTGLPFKVSDLTKRIKQRIEAHQRRVVTA